MVATYFLKRDGEKAALNRFLIYPDTSRRDYSIIPCFNFNLSACFKIQRTANYYNNDTRFLSDCRTDSQIISLIHTRTSVTCQLRSKFAMVPCMSVWVGFVCFQWSCQWISISCVKWQIRHVQQVHIYNLHKQLI